jgi:hypothetical protein
VCNNREERARWFKALSRSQKIIKVEDMHFNKGNDKSLCDQSESHAPEEEQRKSEFRLGDMMTFTEISEILTS